MSNNYNYNWSNIIELKLQKWANLANNYSIIHEIEANKLAKKNKYLQIPSIIFGASSTIVSGISSNTANSTINWYSLIALILSGLSTILMTYIQTLKPEQNITLNKTLSKNYRLITLKIETQLALEYDQRIDGITFFNDISKQLQDLIETSDTASLIALNKLKNIEVNYSNAPNPGASTSNKVLFNSNSTYINDIKPRDIIETTKSLPLPKLTPIILTPIIESPIEKDVVINIAPPAKPELSESEVISPENKLKFDQYFNNPELQNMMNFQLERFNENQ